MPDEFSVRVVVNGDVGVLEWSGVVDQATLDKAISLAADDTLISRGLRRLEVTIPASDVLARRALHRAGFRREGHRRGVLPDGAGGWSDAFEYARLAVDQVYGLGGFSGVMDTVLPKHRVIGHVVFRNADREVLLVETTYKDDWELPGGVVEAGESPRVGAEREVTEELGIQVSLGDPVLVDWLPPYEGWGDAIEFIWDGGLLPADVDFVLPPGELTAHHWVAPDQLATHVTAQSARRLALILGAGGGPYFTTDGRPGRGD